MQFATDVTATTNPGVVGSSPAGRANFKDLAAKTKSSFLLWDRFGTSYPLVRAGSTEFKHLACKTRSSLLAVGPCGNSYPHVRAGCRRRVTGSVYRFGPKTMILIVPRFSTEIPGSLAASNAARSLRPAVFDQERCARRVQLLSWSPIGSLRIRLPVAANIALHSAGAIGGTPGSPAPPSGTLKSDGSKWTRMSRGAMSIRAT